MISRRLRLPAVFGAAVFAGLLFAGGAVAATPDAGPPYPAPVAGQRVYDYAGIFSAGTITSAEQMIRSIEERTGAQVAVYTQVKPQSDDLDKANADAAALMDQWGVGRRGFDDGLVILFDMQDNLRHGQVSLYAGSGYRAAFLSDSERQSIFDDKMKPLLADGDMDGGLLAALREVDANATPDHAAALERGRQINAVLVVLALLLGLILAFGAVLSWFRHGRDPVYLDDPSIYIPAPPAGLTPAMATLLLDDRTSDRTTSAALVGLAAGGSIAFRASKPHKGDDADDVTAGIDYLRNAPGLQPPEKNLLSAVARYAHKDDGSIAHGRLYHLLPAFSTLRADLEKASVAMGWMAGEPGRVVARWRFRGSVELTIAVSAIFMLLLFPVSALFALAAGLAAAGVVTLALAPSMPARTRQGAMLFAMLSAYKRTLSATMARSRSLEAVVAARPVPWLTTPDLTVAWAVAFGLNRELQAVLEGSLSGLAADDPEAAATRPSSWQPTWWLPPAGGGGHSAASAGSGSAAGLFSAGAMPNPGSIIAALGSITSASAPYSGGSGSSSSGSSFSSGSFGGGSSFGGGGAGGGF